MNQLPPTTLRHEPHADEGIFEKDGVYYLRLLFPWENEIVNVALHGVLNYADALKTLQFFCSRLQILPVSIS